VENIIPDNASVEAIDDMLCKLKKNKDVMNKSVLVIRIINLLLNEAVVVDNISPGRKVIFDCTFPRKDEMDNSTDILRVYTYDYNMQFQDNFVYVYSYFKSEHLAKCHQLFKLNEINDSIQYFEQMLACLITECPNCSKEVEKKELSRNKNGLCDECHRFTRKCFKCAYYNDPCHYICQDCRHNENYIRFGKLKDEDVVDAWYAQVNGSTGHRDVKAFERLTRRIFHHIKD
jgi:hypothetical protein